MPFSEKCIKLSEYGKNLKKKITIKNLHLTETLLYAFSTLLHYKRIEIIEFKKHFKNNEILSKKGIIKNNKQKILKLYYSSCHCNKYTK